MKKIALFISLLFLSISAHSTPVEFTLPSKDGLTEIHGQIDIPTCGKPFYPAVMMVGGTGLFTRNVFLGNSGTERDNLFSDIGSYIEWSCMAVVRFDYRGVKCDLTDKAKLPTCLDQKLRATVSDETILDDIQVVYDYVKTQNYIYNDKLFMIGHSEGSLNISRLVARGSIQPNGLLFFGGLTESGLGILKWQLTDRYVDWGFEMDKDGNDLLTNEEIKTNFANSEFGKNGATMEPILSPDGSWTREELLGYFQTAYAQIAAAALAKPDAEPFTMGSVIFASYKWWKRWFTDGVSVLENLKDFAGPIQYFNGDIDSQTPGVREKEFLDSSTVSMKSKPGFKLIPGKGHSLGDDPIRGPMDDEFILEIISALKSWR